MKKLLVIILTLLLVACSSSSVNQNDNNQTNTEVILGDILDVAGDYINSKGDIITLDENGLQKGERQTGEIIYNNNYYTMSIHPIDHESGGYLLMVFPIGVEVPNLEGKTDINQIRICQGQSDPIDIEEIYYKVTDVIESKVPVIIDENEEDDYLVKETPAGYQNREPYSVRFEIFEEIGAYEPAGIDVFVGENNDSLGFIYLSDFNISVFPNIYNEDYVKWQHGSGTGSYVYYGKMNKVADNVYAIDGKYPSDWYKLENLIADDIDFYAVFKKDALYIIFDQIDINTIYKDLSIDDPHYTYRYDY